MRYRFGLFELDDSELVLHREQAIMRLQSQPARVLACLINNRERVVSREELRRCLWDDSTFVDFNGGLNFCIAQVRSTLGDDPSNPCYIRTIPRLGYQFIAPAEAVEQLARRDESSFQRSSPHWRVRVQALVVLSLLILAFFSGYQLRLHGKRGSMPVVAVARFDNETSDPALNAFADRLTDDLVAQLQIAGRDSFR